MLNSHLYALGGEKNHCFDKFPATRATGNLYFVWHPSTRTETFDTDTMSQQDVKRSHFAGEHAQVQVG